MSMMAMPAPATPESRILKISVVDNENRPLQGAQVSFFEDRTMLGTVITGLRGASITLSQIAFDILVQAIYADLKQEAKISPAQFSHAFVFARRLDFKAPNAVAQCPNGDTGQPCVDCIVDGKKIRICA